MLPIRWAVMFVALEARPLHAQASEILGTWRGTSTCVKESWNSACNDEQVIYYVGAVPGRTDSVSNARYHLLWSFQLDRKTLTGTLIVLPERRLARHITVKKD